MKVTRRAVLATLAATSAAAQTQTRRPRNWKPKLGILGPYSEANIEFARKEGFTSLQLQVGGTLPADASDELVAKVKASVSKAGLFVSSLMSSENHTAPDPAQRAAISTRLTQLRLPRFMGMKVTPGIE